MADPQIPQLAVHPLLSNLSGYAPDSPVELSGYLGPSSGDGKVRLHHSLQDLSHYIEFDESSVMRSGPAPNHVAPNDGVTVWISPNAPVRWSREYKNVKHLVNKIAGMILGGSQPPGVP